MTEPIASPEASDSRDRALLGLLEALKARGYGFVTPTPASHARVVARAGRREARDVRDVLGWSLPFTADVLEPEIFELLAAADALEPHGVDRHKCRYRVSSLGGDLYLHSAYPTTADDAVFFGPDSYRFARLIERELLDQGPAAGARLVDIGAGAGVGAMTAARLHPELSITATDINPRALRLARINARAAGVELQAAEGPGLQPIAAPVDIALANPPYIIDPAEREYRDGGGMHGAALSYELAAEAVERLSPGGRLILYTGSAIVDGEDALKRALGELAARQGCAMHYREIDPDVFGEELEKPPYRDVERIAVIGAVLTRN